MARRVVWAPRSRYDIRLVCHFLERDSPEAAKKFAQAVIRAGRSLADFSERGRVVPELGEPNVRELFISSYRLIYEVSQDRVAVLRVIHGSRDLLAAWGRRNLED
ncbi:MAG: type II toxin-antitoxin system RelE/ParE family toxin [Vicinamibacteria bacterium]